MLKLIYPVKMITNRIYQHYLIMLLLKTLICEVKCPEAHSTGVLSLKVYILQILQAQYQLLHQALYHPLSLYLLQLEKRNERKSLHFHKKREDSLTPQSKNRRKSSSATYRRSFDIPRTLTLAFRPGSLISVPCPSVSRPSSSCGYKYISQEEIDKDVETSDEEFREW